MENLKRKVKAWWRKYKTKVLGVCAILAITIIAFLFFFLITPKSSVIYFEGTSEKSSFELSTQVFQFRVRDDLYNGKIKFGSSEAQIISVVDQDLLLDTQWEDLDWKAYQDQQVFQFNNGSATLDSADYLQFTIKMPDNSSLIYSLEITTAESDDGIEKKNLVTLTDFPKKAIIILRSDSQIHMAGNISQNKMHAGAYRIFNCDSISFFTCPPHPYRIGDANEWGLSATVRSFQIRNSGRQTLEFTVDSQTEFKEIGHIDLEGVADGKLTLNISDLGAYPVPV